MNAVIVDNDLDVDIKLRSVVRKQRKAVQAWSGDPESSGVIDREPFKALGDAGKALLETLRREIERRRVNGRPGRLHLREVRKLFAVAMDVIDQPAQAGCDDHRGAKN